MCVPCAGLCCYHVPPFIPTVSFLLLIVLLFLPFFFFCLFFCKSITSVLLIHFCSFIFLFFIVSSLCKSPFPYPRDFLCSLISLLVSCLPLFLGLILLISLSYELCLRDPLALRPDSTLSLYGLLLIEFSSLLHSAQLGLPALSSDLHKVTEYHSCGGRDPSGSSPAPGIAHSRNPIMSERWSSGRFGAVTIPW